MRNSLTFIIIALVLSSCGFAIKTFYGARNPKVETEKSLHKYLVKKKINTDNIYAVDFNDFVSIVNIIKAVPEIMVFSSNNKLIKYKEDTACNANAFSYIENLSEDMEFQYVDSITLDDYLSKLKDFSGNSVTINKTDDTDFYLFIFWTRYTGRLNKNHVKVWEEQANNNSKAKIRVLKVNLDQQEWWEADIR